MLENIRELEIRFWNDNFEIISGKFPGAEIKLGYFRRTSTKVEIILKFISYVTTST